jgi:SAM-dependent methyltransferase
LINLVGIAENWGIIQNKKFLSLLEANREARIIDLGSGDGRFSVLIAEKIGSKMIDGVENWPPLVESCKQKGITIHSFNLDGKFAAPSNSYDVVVSNQVIEHLFFPLNFIAESFRILKPGGYLVLSTENLSSWDNVLSLLFGYSPFSMQFDSALKIGNPLSPHNSTKFKEQDYKPPYPPHTRVFSYYALLEGVKLSGFDIESVVGTGHILNLDSVDKKHCRFITVKGRKPAATSN